MKRIDKTTMGELIARVSGIAPDSKPEWGSMTCYQMIGHLAGTFRYATGEGPEAAFHGNDASRDVFGPQIIEGSMPIPRNVQLPGREKSTVLPADGDLEAFIEALEIYIECQERENLPNWIHPFFGLLSPEQWSKFLAVHAEHHLRQFGA